MQTYSLMQTLGALYKYCHLYFLFVFLKGVFGKNLHNDMAYLALYIFKSSNAVDMKDYSVYQIKGCCDRQRSQDNSVLGI